MEVLAWIRFIIGAILIILGLLMFIVEVFGVFRFKYVLNRMHAAAMGDTLGIAACLLGVIIICGFNFTSFKLFLIVCFLWFSSPTSSHLISRVEVITNEEEGRYAKMELKDLDKEEQ